MCDVCGLVGGLQTSVRQSPAMGPIPAGQLLKQTDFYWQEFYWQVQRWVINYIEAGIILYGKYS